VTPNIRQIKDSSLDDLILSPAFCTRDIVLTKTNLRDSYHFNEIYQDHYAKYYEKRFWFFENIRKFNYNYNYQIGSKPDNLKNYLDKKGENIPQYLQDMDNIWIADKEALENSLRIAIKTSLQPNSKMSKHRIR
jgi:hypothetical protein